MALQNTWSLDYDILRMYRVSGTAIDTVQDLYSWVQNTIDEQNEMDDAEPMSAQTDTAYTVGKISASATQPWFVDPDSTKYLQGGAIKTAGYQNYILLLYVDGITTQAQASDIGKVVKDDATDVGPLMAFEQLTATTAKWWIRDTNTHGAIVDGSVMTITASSADGDANGASSTGEEVYSNVYTLGTIESSPYPQIYAFQDGEALSEWSALANWDRGHIDVLIKTKEAGTDIDSKKLTLFARAGLDNYDHYEVTCTEKGQDAVPLSTSDDLNYTSPDYYIFYDAGNGTDFTVGEIIEEDTTPPDWTAEVTSENEWAAGIGVLGISNFKGTIADGDTFTGASSAATGTINSSATGSLGTAYVHYDNWGTADMSTGNVCTGGTSGAKRRIIALYEDSANISGYLLFDLNTGITGTARDAYYKDYQDNEQITDEGTATADVDGVTSNSVAARDDITIAFVNGTATYTTHSGTGVNGERVTFTGGEGILLLDGSPGTATGTITLGNMTITAISGLVITGDISSAVWTASQNLQSAYTMTKAFSQQTAYPYAAIIEGGAIYEAGRTMAQIYEYLKFITEEDSTFTMYTVDTGVITLLDGEEYIRAYTGYTPVKSAPFGTFAGGKFFGAQGIWVEGIASAQSYQFIDANSNVREPYASIVVKVTGTVSGDRIAVFRTTGGNIDKDMYQSHASNNLQGDSDFEHDGTPATATDTPDSGALRIVDASENREYRLRYASWSGSTFTFITKITGSTTSAGGTNTINDTGATFQSEDIKAGDVVRNTTDGSYAHVVTVVSDTEITTTPLDGGTEDDWDSADGYEFHTLPYDCVASDSIYVPFLDQQATSTSVEKTVLYASDRTVLARLRKYGIKPFETTGTVDSAGYTVAAIRTTDDIVT